MYFKEEIRGSEGEEKIKRANEKAIFEMLRDYDICPTLISKGQAYKIYLQCLENSYPIYSSAAQDIIGS